MTVDFHWHAREWGSVADTVAHSSQVVKAAGLSGFAAIGNTNPALTTEELCLSYAALAPKEERVRFFVHGGVTAEKEQVQRIIEATRRHPEIIIGLKEFFDHSTGNLGIVRDDDVLMTFETMVKEGYTGVLVGHCEEPSVNRDSLYDHANPRTWSDLCRPESSEFTSFMKVVRMMETVGFKGKFHVAHVSTREVVDYINTYKGALRLSCGITPHHLLLDNSLLEGPDGCHYKCNPPLRSKETQSGLLERLVSGAIPIIESDHAPHTEEAKRIKVAGKLPPSGISSGTAWPFVIEHLRRVGLTENRLREVTHENACKLYGLSIEDDGRKPDYAYLAKLQGDYAFDAFAHLKQK